MGRAGAEVVAERFGDNLRRTRRREGLSQEQLAARASLHRTEIGRLELDRSWVYSHAIELGAVKLGDGPRARLRFDPEIAERALRKLGDGSAPDPPARSVERADRARWTRRPEVKLLPVERLDGETTPPAA
jgi:transcriptional regulator with XRE-family HTH domain